MNPVLAGLTWDEAVEAIDALKRALRREERLRDIGLARVAMVARARRRTLDDLHADAEAIVDEHAGLLGLTSSGLVQCPHRTGEVFS